MKASFQTTASLSVRGASIWASTIFMTLFLQRSERQNRLWSLTTECEKTLRQCLTCRRRGDADWARSKFTIGCVAGAPGRGSIRNARELSLNPRPASHTDNAWMANCPRTNHWLMISAEQKQFGCGYCRRNGGPAELHAFYNDRYLESHGDDSK